MAMKLKDISMGRLVRIAISTIVSLLFTLWFFWALENSMYSALVGFEAEPPEGWLYWKIYYLKRNALTLLLNFALLAAFWGTTVATWMPVFRKRIR